jgi:hypothetical protein
MSGGIDVPDGTTVVFPPEILFYLRDDHHLTFFYFEGPITKTAQGLWAQPGGLALILYPAYVDGKPGGQFFISWPPTRIHGVNAFGGTLTLDSLPGSPKGRTLLIQALNGSFRFFIKRNGKLVRELRPRPASDIHLTVRRVGEATPHPLRISALPWGQGQIRAA